MDVDTWSTQGSTTWSFEWETPDMKKSGPNQVNQKTKNTKGRFQKKEVETDDVMWVWRWDDKTETKYNEKTK